ncbi:hypothetical protein [Glacieibacterium sp.]|uniref:hypothetical protein n=1 Tax=Glacieibacterium sp. TaxID=2860237 RepID=UPI003B003E72
MPTLSAPDLDGLVFRSTDEGPGLHVLLVGVSKYPHLLDGDQPSPNARGLRQLDCAARTAMEIYGWLTRPDTTLGHPLRTVRILASPSEAELITAPDLAEAIPATRANLEIAAVAWRDDAAKDRDGATLFYFAGHGIQRTRGDSLLLLADFLGAGPMLARSFDLSCIYDGMAEPDFPDIAQTQYYFVDACRTDLPDVQKLANASAPALWDVTLGGTDERIAPIFHAATAGKVAFGSTVPGEVSAFGKDLLACLGGAGAENVRGPNGRARWEVTIGTLANALPVLIRDADQPRGRRARSFGLDKWTDMDATITVLPDAPTVDCLLQLSPAGAEACISVDLTLGGGPYCFTAPLDNPHAFKAKAGGYLLRTSVLPDATLTFAPFEEVVTVLPPRFTHSVFLQ